MWQFIAVIAFIIITLGLWAAIPVFGAIVGTGLAAIFLWMVLQGLGEE